MRLNRRHLLQGSAAAAALGLPRLARADVSAGDLKFLFVFNNGGWDPTRVFAAEFRNPNVDMELDAEEATAGGITYVAHPSRPAVSSFINTWHQDMLVVNGLQVRSIAHEICTMIALTGDTSGFKPDFATIVADQTSDAYTLPHLVLDGPSFPGELGTSVARTGSQGQLEALLSGDILGWTDLPQPELPRPYEGTIDDYLARRVRARATQGRSQADQSLAAAYADAFGKARGLKDYRHIMDFTTTGTLASQAQVAVDALSTGLSRCVSMGYPGFAGGGLGWDSHADNDDTQSTLFEGLFTGLGQVMQLLHSTPGTVGTTLADETIVVVQSEMGRTPQLNATNGKDHWPYTSLMMLGPGLTTDRVVGAYNDGYVGELVDLGSAEVTASGRTLSVEAIGAALLTMAGIDPAEHIAGADPLLGMLA